MPVNKAIFLDRDGTIIKEIKGADPNDSSSLGYLTKVEQVELIEGAAEALKLAGELGYLRIVITNQSAIARGWLTEEELAAINDRMYELLLAEAKEAVTDDLYYSPYYKDGVIEKYAIDSPMRKPGTGMIDEAVKKYDIDLANSFVIGDAFSDMQTAQNAGTKAILVMTGYGKLAYQKCLDEDVKIDFIADNLLDAVKIIVKNEKNSG